jgi:hypothetical protein
MIQHCLERHSQNMFFFCHNVLLTSLPNEKYSIRYHIQKTMRAVVDQRGPLEYELFVAALVFGDRAPLQNAISALFGMMLTGPIGSKNIKDIGRRGVTKAKYREFRAVGMFCQTAHKVMTKMHEAILLFDWFALLPPGQFLNTEVNNNDKSVLHIWNATNLWLRRGLYNTRPFPAIWYVDIPDLTLEKMEEDHIELEPEKKKLKTEPREKKAPKKKATEKKAL